MHSIAACVTGSLLEVGQMKDVKLFLTCLVSKQDFKQIQKTQNAIELSLNDGIINLLEQYAKPFFGFAQYPRNRGLWLQIMKQHEYFVINISPTTVSLP